MTLLKNHHNLLTWICACCTIIYHHLNSVITHSCHAFTVISRSQSTSKYVGNDFYSCPMASLSSSYHQQFFDNHDETSCHPTKSKQKQYHHSTRRRRSTFLYMNSNSIQNDNNNNHNHKENTNKNHNEEQQKGQKPTKLSIVIVGSGAVGCYYGARLWETKQYNILFHMRGDHYKVSKEQGLKVTSDIHNDVYIPPDQLQVFEETSHIGYAVDWVILALKSTGIDSIPALLQPILGSHTRVLAIMNGLVDEDIVQLLEKGHLLSNTTTTTNNNHNVNNNLVLTKCAATYGGMALLCSNRIAPGHIHHSYAGKLTASLVISSSSSSSPLSNEENDIQQHQRHKEAMIELWKPTNSSFEFVYCDNLTRARWTKNMWNLPFNGISVAMGGITVDKIVTDPGLRRLAYVVMDETISVANADLKARGFSSDTFLGEAEKREMMTLSDNMGPYKTSTMLDLTSRKPMEVKYVFRKAVDKANQLSIPVPTLDTLVTQIEAFQRFYGLY